MNQKSLEKKIDDLEKSVNQHITETHASIEDRLTYWIEDIKAVKQEMTIPNNLQLRLEKLESTVAQLKKEIEGVAKKEDLDILIQSQKEFTEKYYQERLESKTHKIDQLKLDAKEKKKDRKSSFYWRCSFAVSVFVAALGVWIRMDNLKEKSLIQVEQKNIKFIKTFSDSLSMRLKFRDTLNTIKLNSIIDKLESIDKK